MGKPLSSSSRSLRATAVRRYSSAPAKLLTPLKFGDQNIFSVALGLSIVEMMRLLLMTDLMIVMMFQDEITTGRKSNLC